MLTGLNTNSHSDMCKTLLMPGVINAVYDEQTRTIFIVLDYNGKNCFIDAKRLDDDKYQVQYVMGFCKSDEKKVDEVMNAIGEVIADNSDICEHCINRFGYELTGECNSFYADERALSFKNVKILYH